VKKKPGSVGAAFSDLILGENHHNEHVIDISRAQLLILTIILVSTYFGWLVISMSGLSSHHILGKFPEADAVLHSFPQPGGVFVGLLAVTHGVYMANKWQFGTNPPAVKKPTTTEEDGVKS